MSLTDDLKKLLPHVPDDISSSLVIFASTIIVFGIGSLIIWYLPAGEILYGEIIKLLFVLMILFPVLLSGVFLLEDLIEHRDRKRN